MEMPSHRNMQWAGSAEKEEPDFPGVFILGTLNYPEKIFFLLLVFSAAVHSVTPGLSHHWWPLTVILLMPPRGPRWLVPALVCSIVWEVHLVDGFWNSG